MKKTAPVLFFSLLLLICFCTKAQSYNIVKSQAFYRTRTAGNIAVDENGHPVSSGVSTDFLIYIETKGTTLPQWETAYIDGLPYSIRTAEVTSTPVKLGSLKGQNEPITITKGPNTQLWQLLLSPQHTESRQTGKVNTLTLSGEFRNKKFTYRITRVQELAKRFNQ